jgi:predicted permease
MNVFIATLMPMLTLFFCIAIGFLAGKCKLLPDNASKTLAKAEMWIFCPALNFMTMVRFFTIGSIGTHSVNLALASACVALSVGIAIPLSRVFVKEKSSERGVYAYALAIANTGYMGDPIVLALFGEVGLSFYKIFTLPYSMVIYSWGIDVLTPDSEGKSSFLKRMLNAPTVAMLLGMVVGISGIGGYLPLFMTDALDTLKSCMGPVAMLLAGLTISKYNFASMLKKRKVYYATALRLVVLPVVVLSFLFALKSLANAVFSLDIDNNVLFLAFVATATPLGLNTVVFPEAYGGNPETGASMAMISHTLCVISIPILYALMVALFGTPSF